MWKTFCDKNYFEMAGIPREYLFEIKLNAFCREFKGQTSGRKVCEMTIFADNVKEFGSNLWLKVQPFIRREIIVQEDSVFAFSENEPTESDLNR